LFELCTELGALLDLDMTCSTSRALLVMHLLLMGAGALQPSGLGPLGWWWVAGCIALADQMHVCVGAVV